MSCSESVSHTFSYLDTLATHVLGLECANQIGEGLAIVLSFALTIVSGISAAYYGIRRDERSRRADNSEKYIAQNQDTVLQALESIASETISANRDLVSPKYFGKNLDNFHVVFKHFEKTAVAIRFGHVSERYIVLIEKSLITKFFQSCRRVIPLVRANYKNNDYLKNYEILYYRTIFRNENYTFKIRWIESIYGRPLYGLSSFIGSLELKSINIFSGRYCGRLEYSIEDYRYWRRVSYGFLYSFAISCVYMHNWVSEYVEFVESVIFNN